MVRPARPADAAAIAVVHRLAMRISLPFLPELHTAEEDLAFVQGRLMPGNQVDVVEAAGAVVAYVAYHPGWIEHLYVHPDHQGRGHGPALLARALADGSERRLWTFQKNLRARGFYESRGFVIEKFTDGSGNEEREPDILYFRAARTANAT